MNLVKRILGHTAF